MKGSGTTADPYIFYMPADLQKELDEARAHWKELEKAGTPFWCIHKDRDVTHPRAHWKNDDDHPITPGHGVMCSDCHGYIQQG